MRGFKKLGCDGVVGNMGRKKSWEQVRIKLPEGELYVGGNQPQENM